MTSASDLYEQVRQRLGTLARVLGQDLTSPTKQEIPVLEGYAGDAIGEIAKVTDRLNASVQLFTTPNQEYVDRPEHMDVIDEIAVHYDGTPYKIDIRDGQSVAQDARTPNADTDRPTRIGAYEGRLYLYPVPDKEYTLDIQFQMNGAYSESNPASDEPPLLDTLVERVPNELERALTAYVMSEWLKDTGQAEAAQRPATRFVRLINRYEDEPIHQSDATVKYNPLSL